MTSDPYADVIWHDAHGLCLGGLGWRQEAREQSFDRFPAAMREQVSPDLWRLACQPAGVYVEFAGSPRQVFARWHLSEPLPQGEAVNRLPQSGLDVYARDDLGIWRWAGSRTPWNAPNCDGSLISGILDAQEREYRVYLPLMNRVDRVEIGSREPLGPLKNADTRDPVVVYGTSIVHGAGVSRPGMPHVCQLGRMLDRELLNLGFCGRAWCEPGVAEALGRLRASLFVVDCLPNNGPEELAKRLPAFLRILRAARPDTPILLVEDRQFGGARFQPERSPYRCAKNRALERVVDGLRAEGLAGLHVASHLDWFGGDGEGTLDGSHPNDLGAWRMATALVPEVHALL
jgi:hypothetical protein